MSTGSGGWPGGQLAVKRSAGVVLEVNLREHITHVRLSQSAHRLAANSSFKPEETAPEVQKRGTSGPIQKAKTTQKFKEIS